MSAPLTRRSVLSLAASQALPASDAPVFPQSKWLSRDPRELGLNPAKLAELEALLGGRGCVVKDGYMAAAWGAQDEVRDILSSAKPILSTLLFFAIQEGKVSGVDSRIADYGWDLRPPDRTMTFRHLAAMMSGYARPEPPGRAWAYNDYGIQLYQKTLFDRVFQQDPDEAAHAANRLGALGLQDGLRFRESNRRVSASARDFARIVWFWLNRGRWNGRQVLERRFFDEYMQPQTPKSLPASIERPDDDYLGIGTFGGGSKHFTEFGAGCYGFNWWFNRTGRLHPDARLWPNAPEEVIVSIGAGGNNTAFLESKRILLVGLRADWGRLEGGNRHSRFNQILEVFAEAAA